MKLSFSWLDLKLPGRMLWKHPGLTLVGGFSFAVAAMAFEFLTQLVYPSLPVPGGDRIVALRMWDAAASRPERRALHEFMVWRDDLRSVDDIGIFSVIDLGTLRCPTTSGRIPAQCLTPETPVKRLLITLCCV